ncbi:MAG: A/G-specific adenine glycosylase, partial [Deltaproteobacteria bacterium]
MTVTRQGDLSLITEQLLSWYARHQRDLPWRQTRDPYCIWVSEIMLQQTQVETVIPYYYRFLSRFPTVQLLAAASLDEVLKVWENMGYYARARNLHKAAREVNDRCGGEIPRAWNELVDLPGVGSYTAAAILSMAFGQKAPALDANGRRVLSRVFAIDQPLDRSRTQHQLAELARKLLPDRDPGSFNQALMDLGSDICTPRKPLCVSCPIQNLCQAYQQGLQNMLPVARKRSAIPHSHVTAGVIRDHRGRLLIVRRPDKGLLGGLWKFPGGTQDSNQLLQRCLSKKIRDEVGIQVRVGQLITSVDHAFTHLRITLHAFQCTRRGGREQ